MHENRKNKLPDHLADSCKRSNVNPNKLCLVNQTFVRPTGIQALPSPVNSITIKKMSICPILGYFQIISHSLGSYG